MTCSKRRSTPGPNHIPKPLIGFHGDVPFFSAGLAALLQAGSSFFFAAFSKDNKESWGAADVQSPGMENISDEIELNSGAMREDAGIAMKSKEMSMLY